MMRFLKCLIWANVLLAILNIAAAVAFGNVVMLAASVLCGFSALVCREAITRID